jgi:hypothetical protein
MAALPHWEDDGDPWDKLILGDNVMPGVWTITGGECARQVDHKKTKSKDKALIKDLGLLPPRLQIKGRMASRLPNGEPTGHWEALQKIMPDINPRKAGGPKFPLKIYHPAAAIIGVNTIYVERIRPPEVNANGILEMQLDVIEWTETPKKTNVQKPKEPGLDDAVVMVAQIRGAGQWNTSTLRAANDPESFTAVDPDIVAPTGHDYRNPPELSAKDIDPSEDKFSAAQSDPFEL